MSDSIPDRPDLTQLRRRAEELRDAARQENADALERISLHVPVAANRLVALADAQLVIAREHGFGSWAALEAAVEKLREGSDDVTAFLTASVEGHVTRMVDLAAADPSLERTNIYTAAVLGNVARVAEFLAADLTVAASPDRQRGWPPLLYAAYSQWSRIDPDCASGVAAAAAALLAAGASPDTHNGQLPNRGYRSALHGAVSTGNSALVRLLLERGAIVDDRVSLAEAAGRKDHECLRLLLAHGATLPRTWALESAVHGDDAEGVRLLLEAAAAQESPDRVAEMAGWLVGDAAARGSVEVIEILHQFGADPDSRGEETDMEPARRAMRAGHPGTASLLIGLGGRDSVTEVDRLLDACARADRAEAERMVAQHPALPGLLTGSDQAAIVDAAAHPGPASVALMLDLGFPVDASNDLGETALHRAAYEGRTETVRLLLARGASIEAHDDNFDSPPLAFATVGSGENPNDDGDWPATVRVLLESGADPTGVWLSGDKGPSPDVAGVLRSYGVTEGHDDADDALVPEADGSTSGAGTSDLAADPDMDDLAEHLRHAYQNSDLELLATLLHPDVNWGGGTGGCHSRADVIAWYRDLLERGAVGEVTGVEAHPNALLVSLAFRRPSEGGVATPRADTRFQVLRTRDGLITDISGHDDLASARRMAGEGRRAPT